MTQEQNAYAVTVALRHYRTLWFGQEWTDTQAAWQTEYTAVTTGTFKSVEMIASTFDGGSSTARKNFEQIARTDALQKYRAEKDCAYAREVFAQPAIQSQPPSVMVPVFDGRCFPH